MSALRSKKALEEILDRRIGAAEQLRGVVRSIDQAKGDVEVGQRDSRCSRRVGGYRGRNAFRGVVCVGCWLPGFSPSHHSLSPPSTLSVNGFDSPIHDPRFPLSSPPARSVRAVESNIVSHLISLLCRTCSRVGSSLVADPR